MEWERRVKDPSQVSFSGDNIAYSDWPTHVDRPFSILFPIIRSHLHTAPIAIRFNVSATIGTGQYVSDLIGLLSQYKHVQGSKMKMNLILIHENPCNFTIAYT
jgi:hypothetical protein